MLSSATAVATTVAIASAVFGLAVSIPPVHKSANRIIINVSLI